MVQLPQGIPGWTVFGFGLLLTAYRAWAIFDPRQWIEWLERRFAYEVNLRFIGVFPLGMAVILYSNATFTGGFVNVLFALSLLTLFLVGLGLAATPNHVRHLIMATAEAEDKWIKWVSIGVVVMGLLWALAPWA